MPTNGLSVRPTSKQPLITYPLGIFAALLFASCYGLGAWSTVAFTFELGHHTGGVPTWPFNVVWEAARLFFSLLAFLPGARRWNGPRVARLLTLLILNTGSTALSAANIWRQDEQDALAASAQVNHVRRLEASNQTAASSAAVANNALGVLVEAGKGSKALTGLAQMAPLLDAMQASDAALTLAESEHSAASVNQRFFQSLAQRFLGGNAEADGHRLRGWVGFVFAVMADLIAMGLPAIWLAALSGDKRWTFTNNSVSVNVRDCVPVNDADNVPKKISETVRANTSETVPKKISEPVPVNTSETVPGPNAASTLACAYAHTDKAVSVDDAVPVPVPNAASTLACAHAHTDKAVSVDDAVPVNENKTGPVQAPGAVHAPAPPCTTGRAHETLKQVQAVGPDELRHRSVDTLIALARELPAPLTQRGIKRILRVNTNRAKQVLAGLEAEQANPEIAHSVAA